VWPLTNAPVDEQIGHWNVFKKQYKEVEYVDLKEQSDLL
jgi:hypothetical protein